MQPKNKSERTKAFINFLLLFVLSIAIILTTVFFSIQVPVKQAVDLRRQINKVENERAITSQFITKMSEIVGMLDTINTSRDAVSLDGKIKENLDKLRAKADADTVYDQLLFQNVVKNMYDLYTAKKQLRESTSKEDRVKELEKKIEDLETNLDKRTTQYNELLLQSSQHR